MLECVQKFLYKMPLFSQIFSRIIFSGNIVDPVTGKRVIRDQFDDEIELRKQLVEEVYEEPLEQVIFFKSIFNILNSA